MKMHPARTAALLSLALALSACRTPESGDPPDTDTSIGDTDTDTDAPPVEAETRIYATFVAHNERLGQDDYCNMVIAGGATEDSYDEELAQKYYLDNRARTLELAQYIADSGAALDYQTDRDYMLTTDRWERELDIIDETDGKTLVRYLADLDPDHIAVDAHAHEGPYNYADIAWMLDERGVPSTGVVGGFIANPPEEENWTRFQDGPLLPTWVTGEPDYEFHATILTGGASVNHDDDIEISGVYRPMDAENYTVDDPSQTLMNIGAHYSFRKTGEAIDDLLDRWDRGELEEGTMYTASVGINQCSLGFDETAFTTVQEIIERHQPEVDAGRVIWTTYPKVAQDWHEIYGAQPTVLITQD